MNVFKGTCHTCNKNCCDYDKLLRYFRDRNSDSTQSNFKQKKFHRRRVNINIDMSTGYTMDKPTHSPYSQPNPDDTDEYKYTEPLSDLEMEIDNIDADSDFEFDINFDDFNLEHPSITDEFEISGEDDSLYQHVLISTPNRTPRAHSNLMYSIHEHQEIGNRSDDNSINDPVHDDSMDDVSLSFNEQNHENMNKKIKDQVTDSWCKWMKPSQAESESDDDESEGSGQGRNGNGNRNNKKASVWRKLFWLFID